MGCLPCVGNCLFSSSRVPTRRPKEPRASGSGPTPALKCAPAAIPLEWGATLPPDNPGVDRCASWLRFQHIFSPQISFQIPSLSLPPSQLPLVQEIPFPPTASSPQPLRQALASLVHLRSFWSQDYRPVTCFSLTFASSPGWDGMGWGFASCSRPNLQTGLA